MSLKVDKVQLEIIMKTDTTRAEIIKTEDLVKSLTKDIKNLKKSGDDAGAVLKKQELDAAKKKLDDLRSSIDLNGKTMRELQKEAKVLAIQLNNLTPGSEKWVELNGQLAKVTNRISELKGKTQESEGFFSTFTGGFNKVFYALIPLISLLTSFGYAVGQVVQKTAELEDLYADVSKTTGLTHDQVSKLNEDFKKMDTRTSRESLNKLAVDAGKLGIEGRKNILDFVDAGNEINVALGEDLGADAVKNIGKMVGVFDKVTDQLKNKDLKGQMLAVGSAVNSLGQASSASEEYLVDFAGRLGGVASQAKLSLSDILGFGSQLDQDMQHVEMAATSFQNFIMKMMAEPAKFAKLAGLNVKEFTTLIRTDTNAAIKEMLTALNQGGGFEKLIPVFNAMNLDGSRAVGVLSAMAAGINKIDDAQKLANQSMADGTSITNEYNVKNNNFAASLEKAKKQFLEASYALGQSLIPLITSVTNGAIGFTKALIELVKWVGENKTLILNMTVALVTYLVVVNRANIAEKASQLLHAIKIIGLRLRIALTNQATAAELRLVGAQDALNASMKKNLWGLLAAAIAFALTYLIEWISKQNEANVATKVFNELQEQKKQLVADGTKDIIAEKNELNSLVTAILKTNSGTNERNVLMQKLNEKYPEFISFIDKEKITNGLLAVALAEVNQQYEYKIKNAALLASAKADEDAAVQFEQRRLQITDEINKLLADRLNDHSKEIKSLADEDVQLQRYIKNLTTHSSTYRDEAAKNDAEIKAMNTIPYLEAQMKQYYDTANEFEDKYKEKKKQGLTEEASYYQKQMTMANNYFRYYSAKRNELLKSKPESQTVTPLPTSTDDEKTKKQRERLTAELNDIETKYLKNLEKLKKDYIKGDIQTESDYKNEVDKVEDNYYKNKISRLQEFRKTITSKAVLSDIDKKIAEAQSKLLDNQLARHTQYLKIMRDGISNILTIEESAYKQRLIDAGVFEKDFSELTEAQRAERLRLEYEHWEKLRKVSADVENLRYEEEVKQYGLIGTLTQEQQAALEVLTKKHESNLLSIQQTGDANRKKSKEQFAADSVRFLNETQTQTEYSISQGYETQQLLLKDALETEQITQIQYDRQDRINQLAAAKAKLQLAVLTYEAMQKINFADDKTRQDNLRTAKQNIDQIQNQIDSLWTSISTDKKDFTDILTERIQTASEKWNKIFSGVSQNVGNMFASIEAVSRAFKNGDLQSWTDWGQSIGTIAQSSLSALSDINKQYFEYKAAAIETDKQRELTANEEKYKQGLIDETAYENQKDSLNQKYAQKELDLKKQQSSADTVLKVAQTTAAGAMAIMQAYAQLGPIGGTIAAVLIGGISALQIATIMQQNAAIQATTLESTASSSSSSNATGARIVTQQAADGRYQVIGAKDGKNYDNVRYAGNSRTGLVTTPTLYGEAGTELVIDAPTLRNLNMKAPGFNQFVMRNRVNQRADGNYSSASTATTSTSGSAANDVISYNTSVMSEVLAYLQYLKANGIEAFMLYDKFQKDQELLNRSKSKGSL